MLKRCSFAITVVLALTLLAAFPSTLALSAAQIPGEPAIPWAIPVFLPFISKAPPPPTATPTPTATATPAPTATAVAVTPSPPPQDGVYLVSDRGYRSRTSYYVFAEVINGRSEQVCDVRAVARFYDSSGVLVATEGGSSMLSALSPQQKSPIQLIILSAPASLARYTLELSWSNRCFGKYRNVSVLNQSARETCCGVEVFGEVRNDHPEMMQFVRSVVTFYDAGGRVWHADYDYLVSGTNLASGQVGVYKINTYENGLASLPYTVQAQGYAVDNAQSGSASP